MADILLVNFVREGRQVVQVTEVAVLEGHHVLLTGVRGRQSRKIDRKIVIMGINKIISIAKYIYFLSILIRIE